MIKIHNLQFHYPQGNFSLNIPELSIKKNERVVFVGPSGSGKTTLLNLMSGIITPAKGDISISDELISSMDESKRRAYRIQHIGHVFQTFELFNYLSVIDNILFPARINPVLKVTSEFKHQAKQLLKQIGLIHKANDYPHQLSQGEQQRIAVCRALLMRPSLLLADEPTGNLDVFNKEKALHLLLDYAEKNHAALIVVTHDQALLDNFDRVIDFQEFIHQKNLQPGVLSE